MKTPTIQEKVTDIFTRHGGKIHMAEAIGAGISRYAFYKMLQRGVIEQLSRGVYRLSSLPPITNPDLVTVALRAPKAVVCLISALAFHGITTRIPHEVDIAIAEGSITPRINFPPVSVFRFSQKTFEAGIKTHTIDKIPVRIFCIEKTLADCFKFRNRIGMEVVLEALKHYSNNKKVHTNLLVKYARICRVEKIMQPYLEAIL